MLLHLLFPHASTENQQEDMQIPQWANNNGLWITVFTWMEHGSKDNPPPPSPNKQYVCT
jgi:hypothetical protein